MSDILDITASPLIDDSIQNKAYYSYSPFIESFNTNDTIRICIQNQDLILLPSESYLYVEIGLHDSTDVVSDKISLTNNCVGFLFNEIKYELNGTEIDSCRNVGITTSMKNYTSLTPDEGTGQLNAGWCLTNDLEIKSNSSTSGKYNFCIPLQKLFGFAEDYKRIIPNAKHELILIRSNTNDNCVISATGIKYKFDILKIVWKMPHIKLNDSERLKLYRTIQNNHKIRIPFRCWEMHEYPNLPQTTNHVWRVRTADQLEKPRFVIFGLQTDKMNNIKANASKFDDGKLKNLKVHLNSDVYPYEDLKISFDSNRYAELYLMYSKFQESYYGRRSLPLLDPQKYKQIAPLVVVDCSHQNETIKSGPVDIKIEFETDNNGIGAKTSAYCLLLHDRIVEYNPLSGDVRKIM